MSELFEAASKAHDLIFLVLPDGREVIGRALIVQEAVHLPGGEGNLQSNFVIDARTPEMDVCVVLMKLDKPMRQKIILG